MLNIFPQESFAAQQVFEESWESGKILTFAQASNGWDVLGGNCSAQTQIVHSGNYAVVCDHLAGNWGLAKYVRYPSTRGYLSFWSRFPIGYDFFNWSPPNSWTSHWYRIYLDNWMFDLDMALSASSDPARPQRFYPNLYGGNTYWAETTGSNVLLNDNQWHHIEQLYQANSPAEANGFIRVWMDGRLIYEHLNFEIVPPEMTTTMIDTVQIQSNIGATPGTTGLAYVDDIEMWNDCPAATLYSGVPSCAGASPPPSSTAPTDLNGDGSTDVTDVQLGVNQALKTTACSNGDVNKDGACNVVDVQQIVNKALGL